MSASARARRAVLARVLSAGRIASLRAAAARPAAASLRLQLRAVHSASVQGQAHERAASSAPRACTEAEAAGDDLRKLMRRVPAPIAIVTAANSRGDMRGIIASSFQSVSLHPPLVTFNLMAHNSMHAFLDGGGAAGFSVSLLGEEAREAAERFANWRAFAASLAPGDPAAAARHPGTAAQLRGLPHRIEALTGAPVLTSGVLGAVHCRTHSIIPVGDHVLVVGAVLRAEVPQGAVSAPCSPLVWCGGSYRHLGARLAIGERRAQPAPAAPAAATPPPGDVAGSC